MTLNKIPAIRFSTPAAIRTYRAKHQLNQNEFWSRVGVTQSAGSRYESGRTIPRAVQMLLQIAYGTQKQADELQAWLRHHDTETIQPE